MSRHDKSQAKSLERIADSLNETRTRDTSKPDRGSKLPLMARVILFVGTTATSARRARGIRRSFPIRAYVGPNGGGKSLAMVNDILPSLERGRPVLSTVRLLDGNGNDHPCYIPFTDFDQLLDFRGGDVLMDEIVGVANSRDASKLPSSVQNVLVQLRRRDVTLSWSAPNWARSDKIIREVTQAVTECRGFFPAKAVADAYGDLKLWAPRRVFKFRTFDTSEFEEWSAGKREKITPSAAQWFRGPGSEAFAAYDTMDAVSMVAWTDPDGLCVHCDKKKRVEYCKGHTPHEVHELELHRQRELAEITARDLERGNLRLVPDPVADVLDPTLGAPSFESLLTGGD